MIRLLPIAALALLLVAGGSRPAYAETGYDLWLRYVLVDDQALRSAYQRNAASLVVTSTSPTGRVIVNELQRGLKGLLGEAPAVAKSVAAAGAILVGTPSSSSEIAALGWQDALARVGDQGYLIRTGSIGGQYTIEMSSGATLRPAVLASYRSRTYFSTFKNKLLSQEGYLLLTSTLTYTSPDAGWTVTLFADNITNKQIITGGFPSQVAYGAPIEHGVAPPRTVGLRFWHKF